jgi:hypothetical protein
MAGAMKMIYFLCSRQNFMVIFLQSHNIASWNKKIHKNVITDKTVHTEWQTFRILCCCLRVNQGE